MKKLLLLGGLLGVSWFSYYFGKGVAFAYAYDYYNGRLNE